MPNADLVLEGGGVKGVGLVGAVAALMDRGYEFPRVAGTSAGAIVGSLVAAKVPVDEMRALVSTDLRRFQDQSLVDRVPLLGKSLSLVFEKGIYEGEALREWLAQTLKEHGVVTFADLAERDPGSALRRDEDKAYRLVVLTADLSLGRLIRLPWDYRAVYGLDPDEQLVADAVRASMSIPFFFEPVRLEHCARDASSFLVDGGLLSNFPVWIFDRPGGQRPRWPTFGIKLSERQDVAESIAPIDSMIDFVKALASTAIGGHDRMHVGDPCVSERTIFVDTFGVSSTNFAIDEETKGKLFDSGHEAAGAFLGTWDFDGHIERCRS